MTVGESLGSVFPISVVFTLGEQPASGKLTGWANQASAGLTKLSKAIGDLWGEEFANNKLYVATQRPPHIMNIARLIGPSSAINPVRPVAPSTRIEYDVSLDPDDVPPEVNEFNLRDDCNCEPPVDWSANYPQGGIIVHTSIETALNNIDASVFTTRVTNRTDVNGAGDYYVNTNGDVLTYTRTGTYTGSAETYQTVMTPDMYDQATLNVIPDINQTTSDGLCDVLSHSDDANIPADKYIVRTPYLVKLSRRDTNNNPLEPGDDGCPPASFATTERARLPYALKASDGMNLSDGDQIPDGFMGLWDETNKDLISGLTFELSDVTGYSSNYCVLVSGATLTTGNPGARYRLITVGTTITETLAYLVRRVDTHHHNQRTGGYPINHEDLQNKTIAPSVVDDVGLWAIEVSSPVSVIAGNDHPQYLCRYGWKSGLDAGQYDNAMLGDLFLAASATDYTSVTYYSNTRDSRKLYIGSSSNILWYDYTSGNKLTLETPYYIKLDGTYGISLLSDGQINLTTTASMYCESDTGGMVLKSKDNWLNILAEGTDIDITLSSAAGSIKIGAGGGGGTASNRSVIISADSTGNASSDESILLIAGSGISDTSLAYEIRLHAQSDVNIYADDDIRIDATDDLLIEVGDDMTVTAGDNIQMTADDDMILAGHDDLWLTAGTTSGGKDGLMYIQSYNANDLSPLAQIYIIAGNDDAALFLNATRNAIQCWGDTELFRLPTGTSDPSQAVYGEMYYNSSTNKVRVCVGAGPTWNNLN